MSKGIAAIAALMAFAAAPVLGSDAQHSLHNHIAAALATAPRAQAADQANAGEGKILYYQDPMHRWYHSDKPGIAPDCGMKLVPVYASEVADQPKSGERKILYYQDAMNPSHHSDKPGLAPDGMKLVPVYASETPAAALPPGGVEISSARQQVMGVTTAKAEYRALDQTIRAVGQVAMDETRLLHVHVRTSGWIQKVFVDYTWQQVKQGDPLFTFYSPDLLATEQEYLLALKARDSLAKSSFPEIATAGASLLEAARRRLELWDLTEGEIHDIEVSGKPTHDITVYAPATAYVVDRKAFPNQYVSPEMDIYQLVDLSSIWAEGEIYESDMPAVNLGQSAVLTTEALPNTALRGKLTFISPTVKPDTRTITVRMEFPNPGLKLKPGMFVNVELHRGLGRRLTVPVDAVLDSGTHQRVFVDRGKGVFEPRNVTVGARSGDYAVILSGLRAGEQVVTRANFLIDSESNLRESVEGMQQMIHKIIDFSARNKFVVFLLVGVAVAAGWWSLQNVPLDAIPDLSDTQVIIYSRWDRSPDIMEDQVTYPIITALLGAPHVKDIRGFSDFGYSYVYIIFDEGTDIYWARSRTLEYLSKITPRLPSGVQTELGPDATSIGWVFQYALVDTTGRQSLDSLRSFQDWYLRYYLESVPGVAEVAPIGGLVRQYQIQVDPYKLAEYRIPLMKVVEAVRAEQ